MPYRIIYSLEIQLSPGPGGELRELIVPLKPDGNATYSLGLEPPKRRAIDLREGDHFVLQGKREQVMAIRAYRDAVAEQLPEGPRDGYAYEVKGICRRTGVGPNRNGELRNR